MGARRWVALLAVTVLAVAALAACGKDDGGTTIGEGEDAVTIGGDTPGSFPDDIPLPDGAEFAAEVAEVPEGRDWHFDVPLRPDEIADFYSDKLDDWAVESSGNEDVDEAVAETGFIATFDGGTMVAGAVQPSGSRIVITTK